MVSHQHQKMKSPTSKRVCFMDNFYTRHELAQRVMAMTNGEVRIVGTVRLNFVDVHNKKIVNQAIDILKTLPKHAWVLTRAYTVSKKKKRSREVRSIAKKVVLKKAKISARRNMHPGRGRKNFQIPLVLPLSQAAMLSISQESRV